MAITARGYRAEFSNTVSGGDNATSPTPPPLPTPSGRPRLPSDGYVSAATLSSRPLPIKASPSASRASPFVSSDVALAASSFAAPQRTGNRGPRRPTDEQPTRRRCIYIAVADSSLATAQQQPERLLDKVDCFEILIRNDVAEKKLMSAHMGGSRVLVQSDKHGTVPDFRDDEAEIQTKEDKRKLGRFFKVLATNPHRKKSIF